VSGLIVDLFAGGGGASEGIRMALGRCPDVAINHDADAIAMHEANHPSTRHYHEDIFAVSPREATNGRPVSLLWASPSCTHFSRAKGGKPLNEQLRSLAWVVVDWAREVRPAVICLENVAEFQTWGPLLEDGTVDRARAGETFREFVSALVDLGYRVEWRVLNAADFGAPTSRRRLFLIARCDGLSLAWPAPTHGQGLLPVRTAAECIDWKLPVPSIFGRTRPLAEKTLARIEAGLQRYVFDAEKPFLVPDQAAVPFIIQTGYGERPGQAPRLLDLHAPLGTIVAGGAKVGLVYTWLAQRGVADIGMRMLQPHELLAAQGFRPDYILTGTKTSQVARIGNSVCPQVAAAIVGALLPQQQVAA